MSFYVAYHEKNPAGVALWSPKLAEVAQAVAAQPDPAAYEVCFHRDGFAAPLRPDERRARGDPGRRQEVVTVRCARTVVVPRLYQVNFVRSARSRRLILRTSRALLSQE